MDPLHLVLGWGVFWTCLHAVILPISVKVLLCMLPRHGNEIRAAYASMDSHARAYWRRCARSLVYYVFATVAGILLLGDFASVETILHRYTVGHAIAYNMALSHWALTLYEDTAAFHYIVNSVSEGEVLAAVRPDGVPAPDRDRIKPGTAGTGLYVFYMAHHVLTIAAFWFVQTTRELASMTTFGLLYEGPVIFATIRETIVSFDKEFNLLARVNRRWFFANWVATFVCWVLCRLPASLVFAVYSIWYYWDVMVKEVSLPARVSFWIFGTMFSIISFYWLLLLLIFYLSDRRRFAELDGGRSTA